MSYEIKSTPFFQRMIYASKRNGQLQQLKAEYERIKDFNMKAIETKMRQMRLKRLFLDIEDIKRADSKRRLLLSPKNKPTGHVSNHPSRPDNLWKAKEVDSSGTWRKSLDTVPTTSSRVSFLSKRQHQEQEREKEKQTKVRVNRRTNYGNQISNWNMQKMLAGKLHIEVSEGMNETRAKQRVPSHRKGTQSTSETSVDGNANFRHRLSYGNTISDLNMMLMAKSERNHKHCNAIPDSDDITTNVVTALSATSQLGEKQYQSCEETQDYPIQDHDQLQPLYSCAPEAARRSRRAQMLWHKLAMLLKYRFDTRSPGRALQMLEQCHDDLDYKLRSISNDTNLLHAGFTLQRCELQECSESDEESGKYLANEMLIHEQCFSESTLPSNTPTYEDLSPAIPSPPPLPVMAQQRLSLKPLHQGQTTFIDYNGEIQSSIRKYSMVPKEIKAVDKLCGIFEHENA